MRKLLNTLYITNENIYLAKDGSNIVVKDEANGKVFQSPIQNFENIVCFNYVGASPKLLEMCIKNNVGISFLTPGGYFCARFSGRINGNVLLRKEQFRISENDERSLSYAKSFVIGKLYNSIKVLDRYLRDYKDTIYKEEVEESISKLKESKINAFNAQDYTELLGIEGDAAREYFKNFDYLILKGKDYFKFTDRNRRPPKDPANAMLSFSYGMLRVLVQNALETVGLDPYVGFYHKDRPGRQSLALDLSEEMRAYMADRFVLSLINKSQVEEKDFIAKDNASYEFTEEGKKKYLDLWNKRLQDTITHPFLEEKVEVGLLPYVQAMLLARTIRGDLEAYPPFIIT